MRGSTPGLRRLQWLVPAASLPLLLFFAVPLLALVLRTPPGMILASLRERAVLRAIGLSLSTSVVAALLAVVLGLPVAWILARRKFCGRNVIDTLVDLPMVLPPAVAGLALLMAFGRRGVVGQGLSLLGIEIVFTAAAVVLAQLFVAAPYFVKAAAAGLAAVRRDLEEAAMLDGASPAQTLRYVTLPLARNTLLSGVVMAWARALGEFGATIIFAGNLPGRTQTMPLAIYLGFELDLAVALTLSVILLLLAFGVLLLVKQVLHEQIAALHD